VIDERRAAALARAYLAAKLAVLRSDYAAEVVAPSIQLQTLSESDFLRELAWVILSAGMAERVVRLKFAAVSEAFLCWNSAAEISARQELCVKLALVHFGHKGKIGAIAAAARLVADAPFDVLRRRVLANPLAELQRFSYIGTITACHLAKNIGVSIAKPDRHLTRLCTAAGFAQVSELCHCIASFVGDDISKVDTVLWRFATLDRNYLTQFTAHLTRGVGEDFS
jgi:hypothetical protein